MATIEKALLAQIGSESVDEEERVGRSMYMTRPAGLG
jgi:hypothetical protein